MFKKIILSVVMVLLAAVVTLTAQEQDAPGQRSGQRRQRPIASAESSPIAKDEIEKKILAVLEDIHQNQRRGMMNVPKEDGRLLRLLTESTNAQHVVEIGTSNGYSAIWISLALRTTGGKLTTFEFNKERAALAKKNFESAGVSDLINLIFGDAHEEIARVKDPIDILFLDADKEGYVDYLERLLPQVRPGGLVIAHNMHRPAPYPEFIKAYTTNPDLETIFLNMDAAGIGVALKKRE